MEKKYKLIYRPKNVSNYIVLILVGKKYYNEWKKFSSRLLKSYCKKNRIGLLIFTNTLMNNGDYYFSKPVFNKFLFADYIKKKLRFIKNVCYLDADIIVNPLSPNIFDFIEKDKFSVVSKYKNLPYPQSDNYLKRRVAYMRNFYYDKNFPLDSALTISRKDTFAFHNWPDLGDYFNSGLIMFNIKKYAHLLKKIFIKYQHKKKKTLTLGDEPIFNYEILKTKKVKWLSYKFHVLWLLEMSSKYPFLYKYKISDRIVKECIDNTLSENYFVHFSGKWPEGMMWKRKKIFTFKEIRFYKKFDKFLKARLKSRARLGPIKLKNERKYF
jgi:hypothetical protein